MPHTGHRFMCRESGPEWCLDLCVGGRPTPGSRGDAMAIRHEGVSSMGHEYLVSGSNCNWIGGGVNDPWCD